MTKIIYYEYCALVIEALIFVSAYQRNMMRGRLNRWFISVLSAITLATITDIWGMILELYTVGHVVQKYVANAICLWSTSVISVVVCGYLFAQSGVWYQLNKNKIKKLFFYLPMIFNSFFTLILNPFTRMIFYIDDNGVYARGDYVLVLYILSLVYVVIGFYVVIKNRRQYTYRKMASIFLLLSSSVVATLIQLVFPYVIIQMFVTVCAALILLLEVQSPEERIHAGTGFLSMNAYSRDVRKLLEVGALFDVTIVVITNYQNIIDMLGYFSAVAINNKMSERLAAFVKSIRVDADMYYLGNGRYAVVSDDRYLDRQFEIAQGINSVTLDEVDIGETMVKAMCNVCSVCCPKDIDDADFLISFDEQVAGEAFSGELRYAEKIFNKREYEFKRDFGRVLDDAFANDNIFVHYQPVFSKKENRYVSAEAFLRLTDPEYGEISPISIIAEAEKTNSIHAITTFVVEEVCKFVSQPDFLLLGLEYVEINLSPIQCMWGDLLTVVLSTLRTYNVQPKSISFNITDIDNVEVYNRMQKNLEALSQIGFRLIMDDFGSGIFEIERIATMPLMGIKLDKDFIRNGMMIENLSVLKGTIRMISDMEIMALAVGVEDEETADRMFELGCSMMQGYYYCKPVSKNDLIRFLLLG